MRDKILEVLDQARKASQQPGAYAFLPEIIESLEAMLSNLDSPRERRERMAGALGRLVTENYQFSESPLGTEILALADSFAETG
jgi:hypothetical protein